jgi:competence protein ComFC
MILGPHKGILKALIWKYKYKHISDIGVSLSELVCERFGEFLCNKRFIVTCVPISREHLNLRGFNQSELLAQNVSQRLGLGFVGLLDKSNHVESQVGHNRSERLQNVRGKIRLLGNVTKVPSKILIVDDVYTTGATLEECAKVLRKAGCKEVWGLVLSRD